MGLLERFNRKRGEAISAPAVSESVDELIGRLRDGGMAAALAAGKLGQLGDPRAIPALTDLLLGRGELGTAQDETVRLHKQAGDEYTGALSAETARQAAAGALEEIGGPEAEQALKEYRQQK